MKKIVAAIGGVLVLATLVVVAGWIISTLHDVNRGVSTLAGAQRQAGQDLSNTTATANEALRTAQAAQTAAANAADAAVTVALRLTPESDIDTDGVANNEDQCPTVQRGDTPDPERAGCPDGDSDHDGVVNHNDHCRNQASTEANDPDGDGCPNADRDSDGVIDETDQCPDIPETNPDAGTSDDGGTDGDASAAETDAATNPHPGCPIGHEPTVVEDGGTDGDASTTATVEADAASSGNDTQVVQAEPDAGTPAVAPAPPAPVATATPENTTSGNAVMIELGATSPAARRFCDSLDSRALAAIQLAGASECGQNEKYCIRLVTPDVMPTACDPRNPAPGCVTAGGSLNICRPGAESVVVVRYGASLRDRTPAGVAAAITARRSTSSRRDRGGFSLGPLGITWR